MAHGLSCPMACVTLDPRPGIEPASPALEGGFFTTGPPGKSPDLLIVNILPHLQSLAIYVCVYIYVYTHFLEPFESRLQTSCPELFQHIFPKNKGSLLHNPVQYKNKKNRDFPGGAVIKNPPDDSGYTGSDRKSTRLNSSH